MNSPNKYLKESIFEINQSSSRMKKKSYETVENNHDYQSTISIVVKILSQREQSMKFSLEYPFLSLGWDISQNSYMVSADFNRMDS